MLATALASLSLWPYAPEDADGSLAAALHHADARDIASGNWPGGPSALAHAAGGQVALAADVADDDEDDARPWTALARITAYSYESCSTAACLMRTGGRPYLGAVAVDPRFIPLGSLIEIEGLVGTYQALDTGGGVRGWWVDRWVGSTAEALAWGSQQRAIRVTRWGY